MENIFLDPDMEEMYEHSEIEQLTRRVITALFLSGKTFATLNHSKQGVGEIYKIQQAMGLLPQLTEKPKKSNEEAQNLRATGNQAYKAKDPMEALRLYTKAICCAELEGKEMAMAYANRSAVTFVLREYQNSIEDVNRALSTNQYPRNLTPKLFERRGKCFLALCLFQKAHEDFKHVIMLLLQTEIDTDKVNSLKGHVDLLSECVGKQDIPVTSTLRPPKLTHGPSSYIQSASAAVDIKFSAEMGRHVVASVDIAPGEILAIEKPFASVLEAEYRDLLCNNCKRRCHSSIPCLSCNDVVFCSESCRETAWTTHHSVECDMLHNLNHLGVVGAGMLAIRTLLIATKLGENMEMFMDGFLDGSEAPCKPEKAGFVNNKYLSDHYFATHHLITHEERRSQGTRLHLAVFATSVVHILKESTTFFEKSDSSIISTALFKPVSDLRWNHIVAAGLLMRYMMISDCNVYVTQEIRFRRADDELKFEPKAIGGAIYPFYSLLNHSCDPDIVLYPYNGDRQIMIALKPIMKGQQIFANYNSISYTDQDFLTRQRALSSKFYFTCKCAACTEDWPLLSDLLDSNPKFVSKRAKKNHQVEIAESCGYLKSIFMELKKGNMTEEHLRVLVKHFTLIDKYVRRPWKIYYLCQQSIFWYFHLSLNP